MQVIEILSEGLKRKIKVIVPAEEMGIKLTERIAHARNHVKLNGFRLGKVPIEHLRKVYGQSFMLEVIDGILHEMPYSILAERGERSATQLKISLNEDNEDEDDSHAEQVFSGKADFVFFLNYEVFPEIIIKDLASIEIIREVVEVDEKEVDEQVERAISSIRTYTSTNNPATSGDRVTIEYIGKIDGELVKDSGNSGMQLVLGSGMSSIPNFEEQLIGCRVDDTIQIMVTFPERYEPSYLACKEAIFEINVKEVATPNELEISNDNDTARKLGLESLAHLRNVIRLQIENQYDSIIRQKIKRQIFDALEKDYLFDVPEQLLEMEFNNIWNHVHSDIQNTDRTFQETEEALQNHRDIYRTLAVRRVRLGLILTRIGEEAGITVSNGELNRASEAIQPPFPHSSMSKEKSMFGRPEAVPHLYAPIFEEFEEKVVDYLLRRISVIDRKISPAML
ncbi:MAG: trigger factor [Candidatus Tokpelaia sp. JSC085]|nr:MAG: trigger factor [Candidatus Tokpelaia sp. JSC085]